MKLLPQENKGQYSAPLFFQELVKVSIFFLVGYVLTLNLSSDKYI